MLKEIQVTQTLDLRVVYRMLTGNSSIGKSAARDEVNGNGELMLSGIKVNALNVPGRGYSKSGFEQLIRHGSFVLRGWLPHSAATSHGSAYQFWAPQGFATPGLRPSLTRQTYSLKIQKRHNCTPCRATESDTTQTIRITIVHRGEFLSQKFAKKSFDIDLGVFGRL